MASLRYVLLLQRDVVKAAQFYSQGLGIGVRTLTERWAELQAGTTTIALKGVDGEAYTTAGYTPVLAFDVPDLQETLTRLIQLGAVMDGPIQYPVEGKVAALRAPDGHMISLFEEAGQLPRAASGSAGPPGATTSQQPAGALASRAPAGHAPPPVGNAGEPACGSASSSGHARRDRRRDMAAAPGSAGACLLFG